MRYLPLQLNRVPLVARIAAPLAVSALLAAGCASNSSSPPASGGGAPSSAASGGGSAAAMVQTKSGPDGTYLTDGSGRTLYLFMADTSGTSNCNGNCLTYWPALTTSGSPTAGSGVTAANLGTITRSDGTKQVTYSGHPLYYFAQDSSAGQMTGQGNNGFGALWWIVSPAGSAITAKGGSGAPAPSGSSSTKSGSGWA